MQFFSSEDITDRETALRMLKQCVSRLKLTHIGKQLKFIRNKIQELNESDDSNTEKKLMEDYRNLVRQEKELRGEMYEF